MDVGQKYESVRAKVLAPPVAPPEGQPPRTETDAYVIKTYRYVRVLIVALAVGLLIAVLVERATSNCLLGSISAYYYTPARGLFTGGLIGIGVCLIAIRGENDLQDGLLNIAGLLGPMVALIPMHLKVGTADEPTREAACISGAHRFTDLRADDVKEAAFGLVTSGRVDSIRNNTWALLIMLGLGLVFMAGLIWYSRRNPRPGVKSPKWWPWLLAVVVTAVVWALYLCAHGFYIERVHFGSAIFMFIAISLFAMIDGVRAIWLQQAVKRGLFYVALGLWLLVGCAAIRVIGNRAHWDYTTFTVEVWGISVFLVFWVVQTIDLWDHTSRGSAILAHLQEDSGPGNPPFE